MESGRFRYRFLTSRKQSSFIATGLRSSLFQVPESPEMAFFRDSDGNLMAVMNEEGDLMG